VTLRTKTLISIGLTIVFLVALLYVRSRLILLNGFARLEEESAQQNLSRVLNAVQGDIDALDAMVYDWASWDDTYEFIADGNQDYVDSNLVDETFPNIRLNFILYVNAAGDLVYGRGYDIQVDERIPVPESLLEHATGDSLLAHHPETDSSIKGFVFLPEGPLIVASRPILTSEEEGPIHGALIMARYLDDAEIELLAGTSLIPFSVMRFEDKETPSSLSESLSTEEAATLVRRQGSDTIVGYARLDDIYGKPALIIETQTTRDIYKQGERSILYFLFSLLAIGLIFGAVSMILLERSVLARLAYLNLSVDGIGATGDLSKRVHLPGQDELSSLAKAINDMLSKLERAQVGRDET
jgi:sensor domain CHASE-containing protein